MVWISTFGTATSNDSFRPGMSGGEVTKFCMCFRGKPTVFGRHLNRDSATIFLTSACRLVSLWLLKLVLFWNQLLSYAHNINMTFHDIMMTVHKPFMNGILSQFDGTTAPLPRWSQLQLVITEEMLLDYNVLRHCWLINRPPAIDATTQCTKQRLYIAIITSKQQ